VFVHRADSQVSVEVTAPDTITSWVASAFAVSSDVGLGVAENTARVSISSASAFLLFFVSCMDQSA